MCSAGKRAEQRLGAPAIGDPHQLTALSAVEVLRQMLLQVSNPNIRHVDILHGSGDHISLAGSIISGTQQGGQQVFASQADTRRRGPTEPRRRGDRSRGPAILSCMTGATKQNHSWVRIGATYGAVVAEKITALVYHAGVQRGEQAGRGGDAEQAEAGPGWYLVWANEPHRHYQLAAPAPEAGAPATELDKSALVALAAAGEAIEAKLAGSGNGGLGGR